MSTTLKILRTGGAVGEKSKNFNKGNKEKLS